MHCLVNCYVSSSSGSGSSSGLCLDTLTVVCDIMFHLVLCMHSSDSNLLMSVHVSVLLVSMQ